MARCDRGRVVRHHHRRRARGTWFAPGGRAVARGRCRVATSRSTQGSGGREATWTLDTKRHSRRSRSADLRRCRTTARRIAITAAGDSKRSNGRGLCRDRARDRNESLRRSAIRVDASAHRRQGGTHRSCSRSTTRARGSRHAVPDPGTSWGVTHGLEVEDQRAPRGRWPGVRRRRSRSIAAGCSRRTRTRSRRPVRARAGCGSITCRRRPTGRGDGRDARHAVDRVPSCPT